MLLVNRTTCHLVLLLTLCSLSVRVGATGKQYLTQPDTCSDSGWSTSGSGSSSSSSGSSSSSSSGNSSSSSGDGASSSGGSSGSSSSGGDTRSDYALVSILL